MEPGPRTMWIILLNMQPALTKSQFLYFSVGREKEKSQEFASVF